MQPSLGDNEFRLAISLVIAFALCWAVTWIVLWNRQESVRILIDKGNLLRLLAVIFIVVCTAFLALIEKLSSEAATIFAGVAGYVLGGIQRGTDTNQGNSSTK